MLQGQRNAFDTDDAFTDGYDNLRERILYTEIDHDECTTKSIRLKSWQDKALNQIKRDIGTNIVTVVYNVYMEGIKGIRENIGAQRAADLSDIRNAASYLGSEYYHFPIDGDEIDDILTFDKTKDPFRGEGELLQPKGVKMKKSAKSEMKDTYEEEARLGPWIHREVLSIGLQTSEKLGKRYSERAVENATRISDAYRDARLNVEGAARDLVLNSHSFWLEEGIKEGQLEYIEEILSLMVTRHEKPMRMAYNDIKENAEVIEDKQQEADDNE